MIHSRFLILILNDHFDFFVILLLLTYYTKLLIYIYAIFVWYFFIVFRTDSWLLS